MTVVDRLHAACSAIHTAAAATNQCDAIESVSIVRLQMAPAAAAAPVIFLVCVSWIVCSFYVSRHKFSTTKQPLPAKHKLLLLPPPGGLLLHHIAKAKMNAYDGS